MRKLRLGLALIILVISLALLLWGIWPSVRERLTLTVPSSEMTLPTPSSYAPDFPQVFAISPTELPS